MLASLCLFCALCAPVLAVSQTPSIFAFRLQVGIVGGFIPPLPSAIHTVARPGANQDLQITSAIRPIGTPSLQEAQPHTLHMNETTTTLLDELYGILTTIPTELPSGSEDIYDLDTGICWESQEFQWCNGGPQGCGGGTSSVKASDEEKSKFERAVAIANELVA